MTDHSTSHEAERIIIGCALLDPSALAQAASVLTPDDFEISQHRAVYQSMTRILSEGRIADMMTVRELLEREGKLKGPGADAWLSGFLDGLPRTTNVEAWCEIVRRASLVRQLKSAAAEIESLCGEAEDPDVLADAALSRVLEVVHRSGQRGGGFLDPHETAKATITMLERLHQGDGIVGLKTGITDFDILTGGLRPPQLVVIAGRPGMGKSAAATTLARNIAGNGKKVALVSLEMDHDEIGSRILASMSGVNLEALKYKEELWAKIAGAFGKFSELPIYVDDHPYLTLSKIQARARRLQAEHGLDVLIIDYLQLIMGDSRRWEGRQQEIAAIARGLKNLAKDLHVPVIALSQLSRKTEDRDDKRPRLSDLRESGEIEQAADIVVLLYRPWVYDSAKPTEEAWWHVAKHRNGRLKDIKLRYQQDITSFLDEVDEI